MDPYASLAGSNNDDGESEGRTSGIAAWQPADDEFLPGRVGRVGLLLAPTSSPVLPPPPAPPAPPAPVAPAAPVVVSEPVRAFDIAEDLVAEPLREHLLMPAAPATPDTPPAPKPERDFWRRGLAPLHDFSDVREMNDRPLDAVD
jgi:hypothetical protein